MSVYPQVLLVCLCSSLACLLQSISLTLLSVFIIYCTITVVNTEHLSNTKAVVVSLISSFFSLLCTETLIFTTLFYCAIYLNCTVGYVPSSVFLVNALSSAVTITIVLSIAGLCLTLSYANSSSLLANVICACCSIMFLSIQVREFRGMSLCLNDHVSACIFYTCTSLHCSHVLVGVMLLSLFNITNNITLFPYSILDDYFN